MLRLLLVWFLTVAVFAEGPPVVLKGQFHGKVRDQEFKQDFNLRLEPGEKSELRVNLENIDISLGVLPTWYYSTGSAPEGVMINFLLKCSANEPKMLIQRTALLRLHPGNKSTVDLYDQNAPNIFSVDFAVEGESSNMSSTEPAEKSELKE